MITQTKNISSEIANKYLALYEKATKAMEFDDEHSITSLEQYFACMKDLALKDRKYTILPLDEEPFLIDANTRIITVPADFKKNGVAVQGDEVAEILYFKIDRYFDATDLDNMEIYIQWETAPNAKGVVDKGLSTEWVRDTESEPGKIIFGWPLSSAITKNAGNIKFAVRFYGWNEDHTKLTYSFSTLNATATVNPALNFDLDDVVVDDVNTMIENRFENSTLVENDKYPVDEPGYLLNLEPVINLNKDTGNYQLLVQAYSPNAGAISYEWYHEKGADKRFMSDTAVFLPTEDETPQEWNTYYKEVTDNTGVASYAVYVPLDDDDFIAQKDNLFEKYGSCVIEKTGDYYAVASNRVYFSTKTKDSNKCTVPMPLVPNVQENLPASAIIRDEFVEIGVKAKADDTGDLTYQWKFNALKDGEKADIADAINANIAAAEDGYYLVTITNHLNNDETVVDSAVCRVSHPAEAPVLTIAPKGLVGYPITVTANAAISDEFTYQWYLVTLDESDADELIEGATGATYTPQIAGDHFVRVTNHVNGTTAYTDAEFTVAVR